jgi:hypothetical protein
MDALTRAWSRWWLTPVDDGRIVALRWLAYAFVPLDVLWTTASIAEHRFVPGGLYRPLRIGRLLHVPVPTADGVTTVRALLLLAALVALVATARRWTAVTPVGWAVAVLYLWWMLIGQSYGKVDHDRFAYLVLLFVLPTVRTAPAAGRRASEAAGWAVRMVQVGVVATYVLAAWAKVRFGGWGWANGATLTRAVLRRGTMLGDWMLEVPGLLHTVQWLVLVAEAASIVLLVARPRLAWAIVAGLFAFHAVTYLTLGIIFLPHLVAMAAFLPLERFVGRDRYFVVEGSTAT